MGEFFGPLRKQALFFINTTPNMVLNELLKDKGLQEFILDLNRQDQLFEEGIDSRGVDLTQIGGIYAPSTVKKKKRQNCNCRKGPKLPDY